MAVDAATGAERVLPTPEWRQVNRVAWLPDGSASLSTRRSRPPSRRARCFYVSYPSGEARRITSDLTSYLGFSVAPDGHSLVCIRNERRSEYLDAAGGRRSQGVGDLCRCRRRRWHSRHGVGADGRIVFTTESNGNPDIWVMNADGSRRVS